MCVFIYSYVGLKPSLCRTGTSNVANLISRMMYEVCGGVGGRAVGGETAVLVDVSVQMLQLSLGIPCGRSSTGTRLCAVRSVRLVSSLYSLADGILSASYVLCLVFHRLYF